MKKLRTVDWLGATLMAAWFAFLVSALSIAGVTFSWNSAASIAVSISVDRALCAIIDRLLALGRLRGCHNCLRYPTRTLHSYHKGTPYRPCGLSHEPNRHAILFIHLRNRKCAVDHHLLHPFVLAIHKG
jgi:hypothetical protein